MAPTPTEESSPVAEPTFTAKPEVKYWTKANIALTIVFALLALALFTLLLVFYLRRRIEKKKRAHRKSDHVALLEDEDKTSMFSRHRHSSVTLYVDPDSDSQNKRISQDTISLIPLQITPLDEVHDPLNPNTTTQNTGSTGSGVSSMSRLSSNTASTMMLSPITANGEDNDMGIRPSGRPRSTSTTSQRARYYENTPTNIENRLIPKIVTTSD